MFYPIEIYGVSNVVRIRIPPSTPCPQNRLGSEELVIPLTCLLPASPKILPDWL